MTRLINRVRDAVKPADGKKRKFTDGPWWTVMTFSFYFIVGSLNAWAAAQLFIQGDMWGWVHIGVLVFMLLVGVWTFYMQWHTTFLMGHNDASIENLVRVMNRSLREDRGF